MNIAPWILSCGALVVALSGTASADVVFLRSGRSLEGKVERVTGGVRVVHRYGSVEVSNTEILRIERSVPPWEVVDEGLGNLQEGDLAGAFDLADQCVELQQSRRIPEVLLRGLAPGDLLDAAHVADYLERENFQRALPDVARRALPPLVAALRPGQIVRATELARFATRCRASELAEEAFALVQRPGRVEDGLVLGELAVQLGADRLLEGVSRRVLSAPLRGSAASAAQLGDLCRAAGDVGSARGLFLGAVGLDPAEPLAIAGLERLDFHLVRGQWQPPEVYYPAQGYVRYEGSWVLPEEVDYAEAQQRYAAVQAREDEARRRVWDTRHAANAAEEQATRALATASRAQREWERAQSLLGSADRDLVTAERRWRDAVAERTAIERSADCSDPAGRGGIQRGYRTPSEIPGYTQAVRWERQTLCDLEAAREARDRAAQVAERAYRDASAAAQWVTQAQAEVASAREAAERAAREEGRWDDEVESAEREVQRTRAALAAERRRRGL